MVRKPPANGLPKKAAWYVDRRFLVVSAPFLLDKQNRQLRSYAGLRVPSFACNSHIQIDWGRVRWQPIQTWLRFNCLLSLVSVVCTRRGLGNFDSPRKNETEELKFCSKFSNSQKILAYPKLRLDRWNLKNRENITIIAIICQKNLQFAIIVENWELKLLHYKYTGYQWYFSSMKVYPPLTSAFPKIKVRVDCDCDQSPKTNHLKFFHMNESCQSQFLQSTNFTSFSINFLLVKQSWASLLFPDLSANWALVCSWGILFWSWWI